MADSKKEPSRSDGINTEVKVVERARVSFRTKQAATAPVKAKKKKLAVPVDPSLDVIMGWEGERDYPAEDPIPIQSSPPPRTVLARRVQPRTESEILLAQLDVADTVGSAMFRPPTGPARRTMRPSSVYEGVPPITGGISENEGHGIVRDITYRPTFDDSRGSVELTVVGAGSTGSILLSAMRPHIRDLRDRANATVGRSYIGFRIAGVGPLLVGAELRIIVETSNPAGRHVTFLMSTDCSSVEQSFASCPRMFSNNDSESDPGALVRLLAMIYGR